MNMLVVYLCHSYNLSFFDLLSLKSPSFMVEPRVCRHPFLVNAFVFSFVLVVLSFCF